MRERGFLASAWALLRTPVPPGYRGWTRFGWVLLILFFGQVVTGTLLSFYYQPSPGEAALSTQLVMRDVQWGWLIRGLHYWSAQGMVALGLLQLGRVTVQRSWRGSRAASWYLGLALLALTVVLAYSGELLRWDHDSYWSVTSSLARLEGLPLVGGFLAPMVRGAEDVGATTLSRLYSAHGLVLPWLFFLLVLVNLWLLARRRTAGGRP